MTDRWLVTGASRGFGRAVALELARIGLPVDALARPSESLDSVVEELKRLQPKSKMIACDLGDRVSIVKTLRELGRQQSALGGIVHAAGIVHPVLPLTDVDHRHFTRNLEVNLATVQRLTQHLLPRLTQNGGGRITVITGPWRGQTIPSLTTTITAKAGLEAWAKGAAKELAPLDITTIILDAGWMDTDMQQDIRITSPKMMPDVERFLQMEDQGELSDPTKIAKLVAPLVIQHPPLCNGRLFSTNQPDFKQIISFCLDPKDEIPTSLLDERVLTPKEAVSLHTSISSIKEISDRINRDLQEGERLKESLEDHFSRHEVPFGEGKPLLDALLDSLEQIKEMKQAYDEKSVGWEDLKEPEPATQLLAELSEITVGREGLFDNIRTAEREALRLGEVTTAQRTREHIEELTQHLTQADERVGQLTEQLTEADEFLKEEQEAHRKTNEEIRQIEQEASGQLLKIEEERRKADREKSDIGEELKVAKTKLAESTALIGKNESEINSLEEALVLRDEDIALLKQELAQEGEKNKLHEEALTQISEEERAKLKEELEQREELLLQEQKAREMLEVKVQQHIAHEQELAISEAKARNLAAEAEQKLANELNQHRQEEERLAKELALAEKRADDDALGAARMVLAAFGLDGNSSEEKVLDEKSRVSALAVLRTLLDDEEALERISGSDKLKLARIALWSGENASAEKLARLAVDDGSVEGDSMSVGQGWFLVGECLRVRGERRKAMNAYQSSLKGSGGDDGISARAHWGLGTVAQSLGDTGRGKKEAEKATKHAQGCKDLHALSDILRLQGIIASEERGPTAAGGVFQESLKMAEKAGDSLRASRAATNLGVTKLESGDLEGARTALKQSQKLKEKAGDRVGLANVHLNLALVEAAGRNDLAARKELELALMTARETSNGPVEVRAGLQLAEMMIAGGEGDVTSLLDEVIQRAAAMNDRENEKKAKALKSS